MNTIKSIKISDDFVIEYENSSLKKLKYTKEKNRYVVDISSCNLLSATRLAILCSTYCFINNFKKKICWIVKDEETKSAIGVLRLRNIEQILPLEPHKKKAIIA